MTKYAFIFAIAYLLFTLVIGGITHALGVGGGVSLNIASTIAASFAAARWFAKEQERMPTDAEKNAYAWAALASVWLVSLILVASVFSLMLPAAESKALLKYASSGVFLIAAAIGALVISLIYYVAIRWSFSWYVKTTCNA